MRQLRHGVVVLLMSLCGMSTVGAQDLAKELVGKARELTKTTRKWDDRTQELQLRIIDRRGGERTRELVIKVKKYPQDRTRSIVLFKNPADVRGVGLLQWADPKGRDEHWLFLPELGKVRQISGAAKRESFVGTDFSYEDLAVITQILDWDDSEARVAYVQSESIDGRNFHVLEFTPTGKDISYARIRTWLDAEDLIFLRYEMADRNGQVIKRLVLGDVRKVGAIPTPFAMEMRNELSGSRTAVSFTRVAYDTGLSDDEFTQRALERGL